MPELPEVETIKLGLQKRIIGLTIQKIQVLSPKSFIGNTDLVQGQKVFNIWRRAKILGVDLTGNISLLFHLKMSGQLIWIKDDRLIGGHPTKDMMGELPNKSTRVIFKFSDGSHLFFNDQRKFGWVRMMENQELRIMNQGKGFLANLGPEPLEKDFRWQVLKENLLKHKSMPVKVAIMDQSVVSGIGNIYANEACFNARIDPRTKVKDLTDQQFQKLYKGIIQALKTGIKYKGSTRAHFVDSEGRKGYFLDYAYCYGRQGQSCKVCAGVIKKIQLGGRGTYLCEHCQQ